MAKVIWQSLVIFKWTRKELLGLQQLAGVQGRRLLVRVSMRSQITNPDSLAGLAGAVEAALITPFEVVKISLQAERGPVQVCSSVGV